MANFIIKESKQKVDPKHPESHPDVHAQMAAAEQKGLYDKAISTMTEGERKDYDRYLSKTPGAVPGTPMFYPEGGVPLRGGLMGVRPSRECKTEGCGGCCIAMDGWKCPRCGADNSQTTE